MSSLNIEQYDYIVVGTGLAGLSFAIKAAHEGRVLVISKDELIQTNTWRAQGGVASVTSKTDSFENHIQDTLIAGDGLCDKTSVTHIVEQGPLLIQELIKLGIQFDSVNNEIDLGKEGGHSDRRILHIDDFTGQALHSKLIEIAKASPNISLKEHILVSELIVEDNICLGIKAYDDNFTYEYYAPFTLLATGGSGKVFLYTSNWSGATGDGIALAYNAGAQISNMEFTQFHPTCLFHPAARNFLISEALRGEGGKLLNVHGDAFMSKYHPQADLAPRDIVSRAIDKEMKSSGSDCVWLDMSYLKKPELKNRFPKIYQRCLELGIDFLQQPIPVVPAAHYLCGGISVDSHSESTISNLYALGECAETGLHGANRLASNSLLECLATAQNAYHHIQKTQTLSKKTQPGFHNVVTKLPSHEILQDTKIQVTVMWEEIRSTMWNRMGIIRSDSLIQGAHDRIQIFKAEIEKLKKQDPFVIYFKPFTELENICLVSELMISSAQGRKESRGCHFNSNYPDKLPRPQKSIVKKTAKKTQSIEYVDLKNNSVVE